MSDSRKLFWWSISIVGGTTIGAGIFALPVTFHQSGWLIALAWLVGLSIALAALHAAYYQALVRTGNKMGLLELVRSRLGPLAGTAGLLAIICGNLLTLFIYLQLGSAFVETLLPGLLGWPALLLLWVVSTLPLFIGIRRFARAEAVGTLLLVGIVLLLAVLAPDLTFRGEPRVNLAAAFLPFGAILFALTGWTAVEPVAVLRRKYARTSFGAPGMFAVSAAVVAVVYAIFAAAILGFGSESSSLVRTIAFCGLTAIWTSYVPVGREVLRSLREGARIPEFATDLAVALLPLLLAIAFRSADVIRTIGFVGGLFLAIQYVLLALVVRSVLRPSGFKSWLLTLAAAAFAAAAVCELYFFMLG
ncbi:MAG: hypothetical protein HY978_01250 [Candidatus Liptonbacteria bacterium]|nr:hypothetical protein [Candidatus Liptonbacteria bacterium]